MRSIGNEVSVQGKVLSGEMGHLGSELELVREICEAFEIRTVKEVVNLDHVHILLSAPSKYGAERDYEADQGSDFEQAV